MNDNETIARGIANELKQSTDIDEDKLQEIYENLTHYRSGGHSSLVKFLCCLKGGDANYDKPEHLIKALCEISMFITNANIDVAAKIVMASPAADRRWKKRSDHLNTLIRIVWNEIGGNMAATHFDELEPTYLTIPAEFDPAMSTDTTTPSDAD